MEFGCVYWSLIPVGHGLGVSVTSGFIHNWSFMSPKVVSSLLRRAVFQVEIIVLAF